MQQNPDFRDDDPLMSVVSVPQFQSFVLSGRPFVGYLRSVVQVEMNCLPLMRRVARSWKIERRRARVSRARRPSRDQDAAAAEGREPQRQNMTWCQ